MAEAGGSGREYSTRGRGNVVVLVPVLNREHFYSYMLPCEDYCTDTRGTASPFEWGAVYVHACCTYML